MGHRVTKVNLTNGSTLLIDTGGKHPYDVVTKGDYVYVSNSGSNTVSVIIISGNALVGSPIPVGNRPMGMAVNGDYIYVANFNDNTVSVIDTDTRNTVDMDPTDPMWTTSQSAQTPQRWRSSPTAGYVSPTPPATQCPSSRSDRSQAPDTRT